MTLAAYTRTKSAAIRVLAETVVGETSVALIRTTISPKRFAVVTAGGGSQVGIRSEASARWHFDRWVAAIGRRSA